MPPVPVAERVDAAAGLQNTNTVSFGEPLVYDVVNLEVAVVECMMGGATAQGVKCNESVLVHP